jgi:cytochrome c oxidase subunit IV
MERDDLHLDESYARAAKHSEEHGVAMRKTIWKVTAILTAITILEVALGIFVKQEPTALWATVKWTFIILTVFKAAYIVLVFMHLGDEKKSFKWVILAPYILFILYLLFIAIQESSYIADMYEYFNKK